jgi:predicted MFS family arabinose efflux permease
MSMHQVLDRLVSTTVSLRPTGRSRSVAAVGTLAACAFLAVTVEMAPTGLLPQIAAGLSVPESRAGLLVTAYAVVVMLAAVPLTALTARIPRKTLLLGTMALYVLASLTMAVAASLEMALAGRIFGGLAHAVFFAVATAYPIRLVSPVRTAQAVAAVLAGGSAAGMFGVPLATAIGTEWGWRAALLALSGVGLLLLGLIAFFVPSVPTFLGDQQHAPTGQVKLLTSTRLLAIAGVAVLAFGAHFAAYTFVVPLLQRGGVSGAGVSLVLVVFGIAGLAGLGLAGAVGSRWPAAFLGTSLTVLLAALVGVWALGFTPPAITALAVVWGLASSAVPTLVMTAGVRAAGAHPDLGAAAINAACNAGIAGGSALGVVSFDSAGLNAVPLVAGTVAILALAHALRSRRHLAR